MGNFVKLIGMKFDALEGLKITLDYNRKTFMACGELADRLNDGDTFFICIPCTYNYPVRADTESSDNIFKSCL